MKHLQAMILLHLSLLSTRTCNVPILLIDFGAFLWHDSEALERFCFFFVERQEWDLLHMVLIRRTVQPCKDHSARLIQANKTCRLSCNSLSTQKSAKGPKSRHETTYVCILLRTPAWLEERRSRHIKHISSTFPAHCKFIAGSKT